MTLSLALVETPLWTRRKVDPRVELGLGLVRRIAHRVARRVPPSVDVADLVSAGSEGLLEAVAAFDPHRGENFEVYAERRIRGAILDELRAADVMTRHGRRRLREIRRAVADLERTLGRSPDEHEVAVRLSISLDEYRRITHELSRAPALAGGGALDADDVASPCGDPQELCVAAELRDRLARAIRALPTRMQEVLALYYQSDCTQAEIGRALGVTESRVCQILREAARRLRDALGAEDDDADALPQRRSA